MVTFCDILHEAIQKTKTNSRECAVRTGDQLYEAQSAASPRNIDQKKYPLEPRVAIPVKKREAVIFRFDSPVR